MSSWTVLAILAGGMFLIVAVPFWSGGRYRAAMIAYRRLKAGETVPRLYLDVVVHGAALGLGMLLKPAFLSQTGFNRSACAAQHLYIDASRVADAQSHCCPIINTVSPRRDLLVTRSTSYADHARRLAMTAANATAAVGPGRPPA